MWTLPGKRKIYERGRNGGMGIPERGERSGSGKLRQRLSNRGLMPGNAHPQAAHDVQRKWHCTCLHVMLWIILCRVRIYFHSSHSRKVELTRLLGAFEEM